MADKLRVTFPIAVNFYDGEMPSAAKLNGVSKQAKQGLSILEYALGDVWNQSGDSFFNSISDARLMIPNLARYIGSPKHVSPRIPHLSAQMSYTNDFTADTGKSTSRLPFPVHTSSTFSWTNGWDATPQSSKGAVTATNEWYLDYATGDIYAFDTFSASDQLTYRPAYYDTDGNEQDGIHGDLGPESTFNIIPDLDTNSAFNFRGVKLEYVNGSDDSQGYYIYLPPRMPLNSRRLDASPQDDQNAPAHTGNIESSPDVTTPRRFWQSDSALASTTSGFAEHYRYNLPKIITDNWTQGQTLPAGMLYLWDPTGTGTIIEGLTFTAENAATPRTWVVVVTGASASALTTWLSTTAGAAYTDLTGTSTHAAANYPNTGLRLITIGQDSSSAFASLLKQFMNHDHGSQGSMVSKAIEHGKLRDLFDNTGAPPLDPSTWVGDDHPQYLHRYGYNGGSRDKYKGAMLGSLVIGSTGSSNNYDNITSNSQGIFFGSLVSGTGLLWSSSLDSMWFALPAVSKPGLRLSGGTGGNTLDFDLSSTPARNEIISAESLLISTTGYTNVYATTSIDIVAQSGDLTLEASNRTIINTPDSTLEFYSTGGSNYISSGSTASYPISIVSNLINLDSSSLINIDAPAVVVTGDFGVTGSISATTTIDATTNLRVGAAGAITYSGTKNIYIVQNLCNNATSGTWSMNWDGTNGDQGGWLFSSTSGDRANFFLGDWPHNCTLLGVTLLWAGSSFSNNCSMECRLWERTYPNRSRTQIVSNTFSDVSGTNFEHYQVLFSGSHGPIHKNDTSLELSIQHTGTTGGILGLVSVRLYVQYTAIDTFDI